MNKCFHCLGLAALLALGFAFAPLAPEAAPTAPVIIGIGAPLTGSDAAFGAQIRTGVEQAAHDINAAGGILHKRLGVALGDDAGDPKQGAAVAKKFVADHVHLVVGHFNSGVTLAASAIYADNDILDITPASTNPQVTERGLDTIFRICGNDDQQPEVAAKFLASLGNKKIAIIHDGTTYGKALADAARKDLAALGIKDVLYGGVTKGEKDYSAAVAKIAAAGADIVYWGGLQTEAALILKQMRAHGVGAVMMGTSNIASDEFAAIAGGAAVGTYMTFPLDARSRPEAARLVKEFHARNIDPEGYALYAYAAMQVINQAADQAQSLAPLALAKVMHSGMTFTTVLGNISFDAKGDATRPDYSIFIWKKEADGSIGYDPLR